MNPLANPLPLKPWPWVWALVFLAAGMVFFSRHLDFTAYAHPDERSKIAQIVERRHNLHHPLLLLNSVRAIAEATGRHGDFEFVKLAGRWCSVIFSSPGVALLVLASGRLHGSFVAAAAGVLLVSNPRVFELAHYFKEDPALLFGIALSLVAMLALCAALALARLAALSVENSGKSHAPRQPWPSTQLVRASRL